MLELITALLILFLITKPIILIPTITIIILIYYLKIRKYNKSSYYKITKVSYFGVKFDKGKTLEKTNRADYNKRTAYKEWKAAS